MPRFLRAAVSLALLATLAWWLDASVLLDRFAEFDLRWALVGVAISVPQIGLLAFRWRFTAVRLGLTLPFGTALREYYLALFLNQVLPGGVLGDVSRAWRHGRAAPERPMGPAARAVILERASGQIVMGVVAVLSLASLPLAYGAVPATLVLAVCGVGGASLAALLVFGRRSRTGPLATFRRDAHTALLMRDALPLQLISSTLLVGTYLATYVVAARAVGVSTPTWTLLPLVTPVLLSMLIPVTVAGWGVREATAAALWGAVGLTVVDGVAISAAYGILVLVSSLPGALMLLSSSRDRRGAHLPEMAAELDEPDDSSDRTIQEPSP
jgi:uncharacterized membrane protein YbhN (UPF0104 family)